MAHGLHQGLAPTMFSKFMAGVLIVLVIAPFTAPFPTCDLMSLIGSTDHTAPPPAAGRPSLPARRARIGRRDAVRPAIYVTTQTRVPLEPVRTAVTSDVAVPGVSVTANPGRGRALSLTRATSTVRVVSPTSTARITSPASFTATGGAAARTSVLRV